MISQTRDRDVSINAGESSTFKITNNAKIFRILIDGLYADKIQSITREIWSNAKDAHVAAGCAERPFDVSFPGAFDPSFRVRDFGISLTHDQVMHMYTDLGNSTKEDTNDAIGKFGIGSKSPFAYTDNFTVTVVLDGEKRFYSAMIGVDGVPAIHLMATEETDEENGVEVGFPVDKNDISAFREAAKRVSHGFDVKPLVNGSPFDWPTMNVQMEGNGWKLLKTNLAGFRSQSYARMGPVLYPINSGSLGELSEDVTAALAAQFIIDFPMGALEMTASREELSYGRNDPTSASILARLKEIMAEITGSALSAVADAPNLFTATMTLTDILANIALPGTIRDIIRERAMWKGAKVTQSIPLPKDGRMWFTHYTGKRLSNKAYRFDGVCTAGSSIEPKLNTIIYIEDCAPTSKTKRAAARIKNDVKSRAKVSQFIWVAVEDMKTSAGSLFNLMDVFDGAEFVNVDDLPQIVTASGGVRRPVQARFYAGGDFSRRISMDAESFEDGGIYVPLDQMRAVVPEGCSGVGGLFSAMKAAGIIDKDETIYGAPKSMWKKFAGDQWTNLYDVAADWLEQQPTDFSVAVAMQELIDELRWDSELNFLRTNVDMTRVSAGTVLTEMMDIFDDVDTYPMPKVDHVRDVAACLSREIRTDVAEDLLLRKQYEAVREDILARYPLLKPLANHASGAVSVDMITDYVILCDTNAQANHHFNQRLAA